MFPEPHLLNQHPPSSLSKTTLEVSTMYAMMPSLTEPNTMVGLWGKKEVDIIVFAALGVRKVPGASFKRFEERCKHTHPKPIFLQEMK